LYFLGYDGSNIIDHAQKCIKYWEEGGVGIFIGLGWIALGAGYSLLGEYEIAKAHVSKGLNIQKKVGQPFFTAYGYTALAMTHFIEGDLVSAKECAEEALKHAQEGESKNFVAISGILLGRISGETDLTNIDEAQRHILHGISILEELGIKLMSTMGYLHLGEFLANAGRKEEALESLKKAEALYREMEIIPQSYWLTRTKDALKKLGQVSA
jgi:tetratricopeptide (TPR) repeat protein